MAACDPAPVVAAIADYRERIGALRAASANGVGYDPSNDYFGLADASVLYAMVRTHQPRTLLEVGSGNSTRVSRQAIRDGGLATRIVAFDPSPRVDIEPLVDEWHRQPVETSAIEGVFDRLQPGDILFIDSSHELRPANDCVFLYLRAIPALAPGVVVHVHDVFLPYDYPQSWVCDLKYPWNEQYLVHSMLMRGSAFDVLWPGFYLQRTRREFREWLRLPDDRAAQSLWLRTRQR
jgi:predicted O-methyltransferase YrrM